MRLLWQSGGDCGTMMRRNYPQPVIAPFPIYHGTAGGGRGKYGRQKIEIRYHKPDLWFVRGSAYSCGFDLQETKITEGG